jgi:hypothetical protein
MRQQTPEKAVVSTPIMRRAATTLAETHARDGFGSGWSNPGPLTSLGKRGVAHQAALPAGLVGRAG